VHDEARLHARERTQSAVAALELLADQAVRDVADARAAVLLGQRRTEEAELGDARHEIHRKGPVAIRLDDARRELVLDEATRGVADLALVVGEQLFDRVVVGRDVAHVGSGDDA
jgi:hypothetical protein